MAVLPKMVFSFNSYPITKNPWQIENRFYDTIYMTYLSVLYCCKWYKDVVVYTDPFAYDFLKDLPCEVVAMKFQENDILWMKSKIEVLSIQTTPFIHVDNDVFFKKKIDFKFKKVIAERKDVASYNYKDLIPFFETYSKELVFWSSSLEVIPSCGILGFKDLSLAQEFVNAFTVFEKTVNKYHIQYNDYLKKCGELGKYLEPCLILEQYNLGCLLQAKNIEANFLLTGKGEQEQSKHADQLGFVHLYGASKYEPKTTKRILFLLTTDFPKYYKLVSKRIKEKRLTII